VQPQFWSCSVLIFCLFLEIGSHPSAQVDLEFSILVPQFPSVGDLQTVPPCPAENFLFEPAAVVDTCNPNSWGG
jgi:hypothetical protein